MRVELLLVLDCPNAAPARAAVAEALQDLELGVPVVERVGNFASPTVLVDGIDVMANHAGAPEMAPVDWTCPRSRNCSPPCDAEPPRSEPGGVVR